MPLQIPDDYHILRILAIDPGLNNCGYALIDFDTRVKKIERIEANTVVADKLPDPWWVNYDIHSPRSIKLIKISSTFQQLVEATKPHLVVFESSFFNPSRPTAFQALVEALWAIQNGVLAANLALPIYSVAPQQMKAHVKAIKKDAGKDYVREKLMILPAVQPLLVDVIDELTEHAVDAVGIGYAYLKIIGELI